MFEVGILLSMSLIERVPDYKRDMVVWYTSVASSPTWVNSSCQEATRPRCTAHKSPAVNYCLPLGCPTVDILVPQLAVGKRSPAYMSRHLQN